MGLKTLLKILHISDLHLGVLDPQTGDANYNRIYLSALARLPKFDGLLGHHWRALEEIEAFYRDLLQENPELKVVVTGDLSRAGSRAEFRLGFDFLASAIALPSGLSAGLSLNKPPLWISGNHDHWGGVPHPIVVPPSQVSRSGLPWVSPPLPIGGKSVIFCGVDSDADGLTLDRIFARGRFRSQIRKLDTQLSKSPPADFRIILVHHSLLYFDPGPWGILEMDPASRRDLIALAKKHKLTAILTGHTHGDHAQPIDPGDRWGCHEYCCGSSSQIDSVPYLWTQRYGLQRRWPENKLMVHTIEEDDITGQLLWTCQSYFRTNASGFNNPLGSGKTRGL